MSGIAAAAAVGGGLLAGAGSYFGGKAAASGGISHGDQSLAGVYNPNADPLLSALRTQGLLGLGQIDPQIMGQASPLSRIQNAFATGTVGDVRNEDQQQLSYLMRGVIEPVLNQAYAAGLSGPDAAAQVRQALTLVRGQDTKRRLGAFDKAIYASGFQSIDDLINQEINYRNQTKATMARLGPLAQQIQGGRESAMGLIAQQQAVYPVATQQELSRVEGLERQRQAREFADAREKVYEQANVLGYNPAAAIGRLGEAQTAGGLDALTRALGILGQRQTLANTALSGLQGSLGEQQNQALASAGLSTNATLNASQIASQQALGLANLANNSSVANAQSQGQGLAGAFGAAGSSLGSIGTLGLLSQLGLIGNQTGNLPGAQPGYNPNSTPQTRGFDYFNPDLFSLNR